MNFFTGFFKLIRGVNLIYIALTQLMLQYCLVIPALDFSSTAVPGLHVSGLEPSIHGLDLFLLIFSTVIIAASGYMINDYFDIKIDEINKPNRILVDRVLPKRKIMILHVLFNLIGVGLGFYLAWKVGDWRLGFIHVLAASLLWFYSVNLKKQFLIGNLIVSALTALVVMTVFFYETSFFSANTLASHVYPLVKTGFVAYATFAFLVNLIRELIKDMEDIEGDRQGKCRTVPIVLGIKNSKYLAAIVTLFTIGLISYGLAFNFNIEGVYYYPNMFPIVALYFFCLLQLPLLFVLLQLFKADKPSDFKRLSNVLKLVMLSGILFLPLTFLFHSWTV